jgi:hypothetical protein
VAVGRHRDEVVAAHPAIREAAPDLRHVADRRVAARERRRPTASPPLSGTRPSTARISVVLPAPFGPSTPTNSPGSIEKLTSRRIVRPPSSSVTPSSASAGGVAFMA